MNDNAFEALADERRRRFLVALLEDNPQDDTVQIPADTGVGELESENQSQVVMYHAHLPRLEDYGFIRWDKDAHEVVKGPRFEEIRPLLEFINGHGKS